MVADSVPAGSWFYRIFFVAFNIVSHSILLNHLSTHLRFSTSVLSWFHLHEYNRQLFLKQFQFPLLPSTPWCPTRFGPQPYCFLTSTRSRLVRLSATFVYGTTAMLMTPSCISPQHQTKHTKLPQTEQYENSSWLSVPSCSFRRLGWIFPFLWVVVPSLRLLRFRTGVSS